MAISNLLAFCLENVACMILIWGGAFEICFMTWIVFLIFFFFFLGGKVPCVLEKNADR